MDVRPVAEMHPRAFRPVRRIALASLTDADLEDLLTGREPLVLENLEQGWSPEARDASLREIVTEERPRNVHIDGLQHFNVPHEQFFSMLEAGRNVRIFGCDLTPKMNRAFALPERLQSRLKIFRYDDSRPAGFIGGGGAITLIHQDFELNANWHYVLSGKRRAYLWTRDQSSNLFKLPFIGLTAIPFSAGLLDCRFAEGYECALAPGELLYMPPGCWHQIEYAEPSLALTYSFHGTEAEKQRGTRMGYFWRGIMGVWQGVAARNIGAILSLPLLLPLAIFTGFYVPARFIGRFVLRRASFLIDAPCRAIESALFAIYFPLLNLFRRKMWAGY
jgi:hypothetical protein